MGTRPTSDRLRETLFNVLSPRLPGARFADLYAGSGAVGIEALSRGASFCGFAERAPAAVTALRANLVSLGIRSGFTVDNRSVARVLEHWVQTGVRFDLVFFDPPYEAATEYTATLELLSREAEKLLAPGALVIAEHARRTSLAAQFGALSRTRVLEQGDAALSFFAPQERADTQAAR